MTGLKLVCLLLFKIMSDYYFSLIGEKKYYFHFYQLNNQQRFYYNSIVDGRKLAWLYNSVNKYKIWPWTWPSKNQTPACPPSFPWPYFLFLKFWSATWLSKSRFLCGINSLCSANCRVLIFLLCVKRNRRLHNAHAHNILFYLIGFNTCCVLLLPTANFYLSNFLQNFSFLFSL